MTQPQDEAPTPAQEAGTPETDALIAFLERASGAKAHYINPDFARKLEKDRDRLRSSLATAERERDEKEQDRQDHMKQIDRLEKYLEISPDTSWAVVEAAIGQLGKLRADLAAAQKERDDLIAQLHVIFTELKKIPCLQGEGPRKGT